MQITILFIISRAISVFLIDVGDHLGCYSKSYGLYVVSKKSKCSETCRTTDVPPVFLVSK